MRKNTYHRRRFLETIAMSIAGTQLVMTTTGNGIADLTP
jgi:hypothetical protein